MSNKNIISSDNKDKIINQYSNLRKEVDYNTRDYSIDFLVDQFNKSEFFINPDYQRNFVWNQELKCKFIESILLWWRLHKLHQNRG
jgi:uncharacterized protein with ParB-like and HNH nuclease domain